MQRQLLDQKIEKPAQNSQKDEQKEIMVEKKEGLENINQETMFQMICSFLKERAIQFQILEHQPTRTSEQSAQIRKTPLQWGCKTMLVKGEGVEPILLVYRAHLKISWKKLRKTPIIGRKAKMADQSQIYKLGLKPGGVPPFPQLVNLKGVLDSKFKQVQDMAFNAGHKCKSIIMKTEDFPFEGNHIESITQD